MTPLPHPCQRHLTCYPPHLIYLCLLADLAQAQGGSPADPSVGAGNLDDLTSLFSKEKQTVSGKGPKRCQGFAASRPWERCGWQQPVGKWNSVLVTVVTTDAL